MERARALATHHKSHNTSSCIDTIRREMPKGQAIIHPLPPAGPLGRDSSTRGAGTGSGGDWACALGFMVVNTSVGWALEGGTAAVGCGLVTGAGAGLDASCPEAPAAGFAGACSFPPEPGGAGSGAAEAEIKANAKTKAKRRKPSCMACRVEMKGR